MIGSLAGTALRSCSSSLCDMGAGASGFGCLLLAREEGLDPEILAGARGSGGADSLTDGSAGPSFTMKQSVWLSGTAGALAGERPRTAGRTVCLLPVSPFAVVQSSIGGPRSSSRKSSSPPLIKPESGSVVRGGRLGLDRLGNKMGGDDGMLNEGSKRPW